MTRIKPKPGADHNAKRHRIEKKRNDLILAKSEGRHATALARRDAPLPVAVEVAPAGTMVKVQEQPFRAKVNRFRKLLYKSVSDNDFRRIITRLKRMARAGDLKATEILLERLLGRVPVDIWEWVNDEAEGPPEDVRYL